MIESTDLAKDESSNIVLIDFGISKRYLNEEGLHLPLHDCNDFSGNIYFSSKNAFQHLTLSRRDDLISLCYLLAYLMNGETTWINKEIRDKRELHRRVAAIKKDMKPKEFCIRSAQGLLPFAKKVWSLKFEQKPDYD